jgi:hypothetical protein
MPKPFYPAPKNWRGPSKAEPRSERSSTTGAKPRSELSSTTGEEKL